MDRKLLFSFCSLILVVLISLSSGCGRFQRVISPEKPRASLPGGRGYAVIWIEDMSIFDTPRVKAAINVLRQGDEHELKKTIRRAIQDLRNNPASWHRRKADAYAADMKAKVISIFAYASPDSRQDPMLAEEARCLLGRALYVSSNCETGRIPRFDPGGAIKLDRETFFWKQTARLSAEAGNGASFPSLSGEEKAEDEVSFEEPRIGPEEVTDVRETPSSTPSTSPRATQTPLETPSPSPEPRLTGVVSGPDKIMAIISIGPKSFTVSPGERFAGQFYVRKITRREVILEKNGRKMTVKLEE